MAVLESVALPRPFPGAAWCAVELRARRSRPPFGSRLHRLGPGSARRYLRRRAALSATAAGSVGAGGPEPRPRAGEAERTGPRGRCGTAAAPAPASARTPTSGSTPTAPGREEALTAIERLRRTDTAVEQPVAAGDLDGLRRSPPPPRTDRLRRVPGTVAEAPALVGPRPAAPSTYGCRSAAGCWPRCASRPSPPMPASGVVGAQVGESGLLSAAVATAACVAPPTSRVGRPAPASRRRHRRRCCPAGRAGRPCRCGRRRDGSRDVLARHTGGPEGGTMTWASPSRTAAVVAQASAPTSSKTHPSARAPAGQAAGDLHPQRPHRVRRRSTASTGSVGGGTGRPSRPRPTRTLFPDRSGSPPASPTSHADDSPAVRHDVGHHRRGQVHPGTPSTARVQHGVHVHTYRLFSVFPTSPRAVLRLLQQRRRGPPAGGVPTGHLRYLIAPPCALRRFFVVPRGCRVKDIEAKYYLALRHALRRHPRIVTPNPSSLLLLAEAMRTHADELIEDIGGGPEPAYLPPGAGAGPGPVSPPGWRPPPGGRPRLGACRGPAGASCRRGVAHLRVITAGRAEMPLYLRKLPSTSATSRCGTRLLASEGRARRRW